MTGNPAFHIRYPVGYKPNKVIIRADMYLDILYTAGYLSRHIVSGRIFIQISRIRPNNYPDIPILPDIYPDIPYTAGYSSRYTVCGRTFIQISRIRPNIKFSIFCCRIFSQCDILYICKKQRASQKRKIIFLLHHLCLRCKH